MIKVLITAIVLCGSYYLCMRFGLSTLTTVIISGTFGIITASKL